MDDGKEVYGDHFRGNGVAARASPSYRASEVLGRATATTKRFMVYM
jgi:hypothetical protein